MNFRRHVHTCNHRRERLNRRAFQFAAIAHERFDAHIAVIGTQDEGTMLQNHREGHSWQNKTLERLQFLAGLEAHSFAGRDTNFLAGARIAPYASLARTNIENAEAAQLNAFSLTECAFHGAEDGFNG